VSKHELLGVWIRVIGVWMLAEALRYFVFSIFKGLGLPLGGQLVWQQDLNVGLSFLFVAAVIFGCADGLVKVAFDNRGKLDPERE